MLNRFSVGPSLGFDSPKRMRCVSTGQTSKPPMAPFLPELSLGEAAQDQDISATLQMRGSDEYVSSSAEEEEEDLLRSEELEESATPPDKPSTPVPLLTPPGSPVRVEGEEGTTTMCEWPSNLAVDTALAAAADSDLRPLSPSSLQKQDEEEEERILASKTTRIPETSTLTPLIRGMSVNFV